MTSNPGEPQPTPGPYRPRGDPSSAGCSRPPGLRGSAWAGARRHRRACAGSGSYFRRRPRGSWSGPPPGGRGLYPGASPRRGRGAPTPYRPPRGPTRSPPWAPRSARAGGNRHAGAPPSPQSSPQMPRSPLCSRPRGSAKGVKHQPPSKPGPIANPRRASTRPSGWARGRGRNSPSAGLLPSSRASPVCRGRRRSSL